MELAEFRDKIHAWIDSAYPRHIPTMFLVKPDGKDSVLVYLVLKNRQGQNLPEGPGIPAFAVLYREPGAFEAVQQWIQGEWERYG